MKTLKTYLYLLLLLLSISGKSQVNLDSLWTVWNDESKADTSRLKAMKSIAYDGYLFSQPDSAFYYAELVYDFAQSINNKKYMAGASFLQGKAYKKQRNLLRAIDYYMKSLKISEDIEDKESIAAISNNIGNIYKSQGNLDKALEYHLNSLKIAKELGHKKDMAKSFNNIGNVYSSQGDLQKSMDYHIKSLNISEEIDDKELMATSFNNIGIIYEDKGDLEKAMDNHIKSLKISEDIGIKYGTGNSFNNIGSIYQAQGDLQKAMEYYMKSLKISEEIGQKRRIAQRSNSIGIIYQDRGDLQKAMEYFLKSKKLYKELNVINGLDKTAELLMQLYEKLGMPQKALENYKLYVTIKDSLATMDGIEKEKQRQFHEQYLLEKQADSIKHADEILIQQAQTLAKEEQLKSETQRRNGLVVISLLILMSLGLVFTQLKKVRAKNFIIEEKQQEITDSINYAKRLQQGILVPFDLVQSWLSESFILFKPKDIVSGDFYWIEKVGDKIYFAVADCTGHGIPGALVSIICSNALSKALYEDKITAPAKILDATREIVEKRFVRSTDNIKDGMDISLCCLNVKTKTVSWAGAMNPLWIIKKDSNKIEELKPDRQAIGFVEKPKSFKEHKVKLELNDVLYLFSDGYQDQFGGEKGKKYMKGKMKKFVLSVQDQDMQTQLASFDKEFNSWKGSHEQIDDVCVMGVKVT